MTTQDVINKMYQYLETKRRNEDCHIDRTYHNHNIQDLILDLSENLDE